MDTKTRKMVGAVLVAIGVVVAAVGVFADSLGLGGEGASDFGTKQVAALVVGLVIVAAGAAVALVPMGARGGVGSAE